MKIAIKMKNSKAISLLICLLLNVVLLKSQTNGPTQIEFSKSSGGSGSSVNEFTGGFSQSIPVITIPGPNGSDYSMSLTYQSGSSPTEPASWVGFGWSLNPGAIVRQKRGFPDDYKDVKVKYWNKTRRNITVQKAYSINVETMSVDGGLAGGINSQMLFNNYSGMSYSNGVSLGYWGATIGAKWDDKGDVFYGVGASLPSIFLKIMRKKDKDFLVLDGWLDCSFLLNIAKNLLDVTSLPTLTKSQIPSSGLLYSGTSIYRSYSAKVGYSPLFEIETTLPVNISGTTIMETVGDKDYPVYGYMYSGDINNNQSIMDYYTERDNSNSKTDRYLGIPMNNADNFIVMGNRIGGSFRVRNSVINRFRPIYTDSKIPINGLGKTFGFNVAGYTFFYGYDKTTGFNQLRTDEWSEVNKQDDVLVELKQPLMTSGQNKEKTIFRFNGDVGSSMLLGDVNTYSSTKLDEPIKADLVKLKDGNYKPAFNSETFYSDSTLKNRVTNIEYNTFRDIANSGYNNIVIFSRYLKDNAKKICGISEDLIAEYSIVGKDGYRYNYGLPVFNRNERSLQYGINNEVNTNTQLNGDNTIVNMGVVPTNSKITQGTESNEPYVGTYLLTEIYTPDYVDVTGDGPTIDDLGGYTLFNYRRVAGDDNKRDNFVGQWKNITRDISGNIVSTSYVGYAKEQNDKWYKWRSPYYGLYYSKNSLSDYQDDMGSFMMGESEIYYLESIETKTHTAYFVTNKTDKTVKVNGTDFNLKGSQQNRKDGYEANHNEYEASSGIINMDSDNKLEYLEKIILLAKDLSNQNSNSTNTLYSKLISTINMQYDATYSIWSNQPNSKEQKGKLTLKRMWEDNGVVKNWRISSYEFGYTYNEGNFTDNLKIANGKNENPSFSYADIDSWGYYQADGVSRSLNHKEWVNQFPVTSFDPAAWNLKEIKYPSGASTRIQYEQSSYRYVQNKDACILLNNVSIGKNCFEISRNTLYNIGLNDSQIKNYSDYLSEKIKNKMIYYHYLYKLIGENAPTLTEITSDYIDGFIRITDVVYNINSINPIQLKYDVEFAPSCKCDDFYQNRRKQYIQRNLPSNNINDTKTSNYIELGESENKLDGIWGPFRSYNESDTICDFYNSDLSYIKLPIPEGLEKKGGGIRVKRLFSIDKFDNKMEGALTKIYGSEYLYVDREGECSGVATSEPFNSKHDNALVEFLDCYQEGDKFKFIDRNSGNVASYQVSKKNFDQYEGPLGETIYPGASVGYSNVFIKSIIPNQSYQNTELNGGIVEKSYYTCFDNPIKFDFTEINNQMNESSKWFPEVNWSLCSNIFVNYFQSQGYIFKMNDMHGQPKSVTTYKGVLTANKPYNIPSFITEPIQYTKYNYFNYGDMIPIYNFEKNRLDYSYLGADIEINTESKGVSSSHEETTQDYDIALSFSPFPFLYPNYNFKKGKSHSDLRTHVTSKIVRYPALLKSIETEVDGIKNIVENVAFNRKTGDVVIIKTNDGYHDLELQQPTSGVTKHDGTYHNLSIPAVEIYPQLGNKSENQYMSLSSVKDKFYIYRKIGYENGTNNFSLIFDFYNDSRGIYGYYKELKDTLNESCWECNYLKRFAEGDIIRVTPKTEDKSEENIYQEYYQVRAIEGNQLSLLPLGKEATLPYSKVEVDVFIVKSGKKNLLNANYANISTYGLNSTFTQKVGDEIVPFGFTKSINTKNDEFVNRQKVVDGLNTLIRMIMDGYLFTDVQTIAAIDDLNRKLGSVYFKDKNGNPVKYTFYNPATGDKYADKIKLEYYEDLFTSTFSYKLKVNKSDCSSSSEQVPVTGYKHPFVDILNNFYEKLYCTKLNNLMPEIDWSDSHSYENGDIITWTDNINDEKRYQFVQLNEKLREELNKKIGYTKLLDSKYIINGAELAGYEIIKDANYNLELENQDPTKGKLIKVIVDRYSHDVILGQYLFSVGNEVFGVLRYPGFGGTNEEIYLPQQLPSSCPIIYKGDKNQCTYFESYDKSLIGEFVSNIPKLQYLSNGNKVSTDLELYNSYNPGECDECITNLIWATNVDPYDFTPILLNSDGQMILNREPSYYNAAGYNGIPHIWCNYLSCLEFYDDIKPAYTLNKGVIAASASILTDKWEKENIYQIKPANSINKYLTGEIGQWRPKESYVYNDSLLRAFSSASSAERIYADAGVFKNPFYLINGNGYNYFDVETKLHWKSGGTVTKYNTYGLPLESKDNTDIYRSIKYGEPGYNYYLETLASNPVKISKDSTEKLFSKDYVSMVIANAQNENCGFQSWENILNYDKNIYKDKSLLTKLFAHTGNYSRKVTQEPYKVFSQVKLPANMNGTSVDPEKGILIKAWAKTDEIPTDPNNLNTDCKIYVKLIDPTNSAIVYNNKLLRKIQTGEWTLYEAEIPALLNNPSVVDVCLYTNSSNNVYVDDILIKPINSAVQCYVYDYEKQRLTDEIDDLHLATHYQYNFEGEMDKIMKETDIGWRSIVAQAHHTTSFLRASDYKPFPKVNSMSSQNSIYRDNNLQIPAFNKIYDYDDFEEDADSTNTNIIDGKLDLFKLDMSPDKQNIDIFNIKKLNVPDTDSLINIPDAEGAIKGINNNFNNLKVNADSSNNRLKELKNPLDSVTNQIEKKYEDTKSIDVKKELNSKKDELNKEKDEAIQEKKKEFKKEKELKLNKEKNKLK